MKRPVAGCVVAEILHHPSNNYHFIKNSEQIQMEGILLNSLDWCVLCVYILQVTTGQHETVRTKQQNKVPKQSMQTFSWQVNSLLWLSEEQFSVQLLSQLVCWLKRANVLSQAARAATQTTFTQRMWHFSWRRQKSLDIDSKAFESQFNMLSCDYQLILLFNCPDAVNLSHPSGLPSS